LKFLCAVVGSLVFENWHRCFNSTVHNLRLHAAFDNEICGRPQVISNIRFGGRDGVYWSKTNTRQENQWTRCVTIWTVMSQRITEWIRNLCLNVFCVGWHLAVPIL